MVLISPERFFNEDFLTIIKSDKLQISMVTVDEVHCLSEWGHDFRTSYLCLIHYLKENLDKNCRLIGLTATASPRVCEDVEIEFSNFKGQTKIIQSDSLKRNNLNLVVKAFDFKGREYDKNSKYKELYDLYQNEQAIKEKTVVFTTTKSRSSYVTNSCYNLANKIRNDMGYQDADLTVDFFSANTDNNDDEQDINEVKLENFKSGKTNLLFSTKAFGMGIDIPDIRKTIHFSLPSSIESLYQEFGRAGRDGKQSECLIWYYKEDEKIMNNLFENKLSMKAVDNAKSKFNEFQTNLYFLTMGNLDIEEESYFIVYLYRYLTLLSERNPDVSFYANEFIVSFKEYSVKHNKKEFNITVKDVILKAEDTQYGSEEVLIPIEGEFNVSVSKEQTLKDTNIFSPEIKDIKHGDLTGKIDKVIDTPLQTIIKISYNYRDVSLNKLSQSWNKDFIDILEYNAYDENGESLGILPYETERKITYANGKEEEWAVGDIGTFINFTNAKMDITEYLIIEKKQNNSKIKVEIKEQSDKKAFDNFEIDLKSQEK